MKSIIKFLGKFPRIKKNLKRSYQILAFLIFKHKKQEFFFNKFRVFSIENKESFFGYYDKSPINSNKRYVLFHSTDIDSSRRPKGRSSIDIIVYDLQKNEIRSKSSTNTWNWQQGSRLQWLTENLFIYNNFDNQKKKFVAVVENVDTGEKIKQFGRPIQDAYKDEYLLSLNYTRLNTLRPDYGYRNLNNLNLKELQDIEHDGIWFVDFNSGKDHLLLSLRQILDFNYLSKFEGGQHYVNHIMIAPNGGKFVFLHRYFKKGVRYDRLILSDLKGNMVLLADNDMVSHYYWYGNEHIFGYMRGENGQDGYYLIHLYDQKMVLFNDEELQKLGDGHPNMLGNYYVTDNYPDKSRTQTLVLGNIQSKNHKVIAKLHNGLNFNGESRCDLHPRLSHDGELVFFDSVNAGKRQLYMMDISNLKF